MQDSAPTVGTARNGVGTLLRDAREQRGIDIEGVARALRIRHPYLVAIEEGRFGDLPGAPYASGFVRSYAEFLSLDANEILRRFREESGGAGARTELIFPAPVSEGGFPAAVLIGLVIVLAAVIYGIWYFYQWRHNGSAESVSELPDRLAALINPPGSDGAAASTNANKSPSQAMAGTTAELTGPSAQFEVGKPDLTPAGQTVTSSTPSAPTTTQTATPNPPAATEPTPAPAATTAAAPTPVASAPAAPPPPIPVPAPAATANSTPAPSPAPVATAAATPAAEPAAPPNPPADAPKPAASAEAPSAQAVVATATPPPAPEMAPPSRVVLRATDDCWIEIRDASGEVVISRLLHRGDAFPVPPRPGETLTVGNAGAIALLLDGSLLPPLGKAGMVRHDVPIDPEHLTGQPSAAPATATPPAAPASTAND
jgi:cytoskeletal protein RodZ